MRAREVKRNTLESNILSDFNLKINTSLENETKETNRGSNTNFNTTKEN